MSAADGFPKHIDCACVRCTALEIQTTAAIVQARQAEEKVKGLEAALEMLLGYLKTGRISP